MWKGRCSVKEIIYDCPDNKCKDHRVECNEGSSITSFCLTGDCVPQERTEDQDINKALSALAALADASKQLDDAGKYIFVGQRGECRNDSLGAKNCCSNGGWAQGLKLTSCDDDSRKLMNAKRAGLAAYVGGYSEKKGIPPATWKQHIETYCIFKSKLARIVQVAGRTQLGIPFGDPKSPNCRGLTPEELQKVDFAKIDFSEVYQDIQSKMNIESAVETNKRVQEKTLEFVKNLNPVKKMKKEVRALQKSTQDKTGNK